MTWSGIKIHFRVVVGPLVEVLYEHSNWRAECCTELCSRLYLYSIFLITLESVEDRRDIPELSELTVLVSVATVEPGRHPPSIAFLLVKTVSKVPTWRTILDYTSYAFTMRFSISGYSEQSPKGRHSLEFRPLRRLLIFSLCGDSKLFLLAACLYKTARNAEKGGFCHVFSPTPTSNFVDLKTGSRIRRPLPTTRISVFFIQARHRLGL